MREISKVAEGTATDRNGALARVGTTIDRSWHLDALIGVGGMGAVYSATHASGRRGAFKVMHARHARDEQLVTRFVREQSISSKVRHPACIDIHGAGNTDDGVPLLVMELLDGETLEQRLARVGRFSIGEALALGEMLLDFLVACHAAGVVHRDLKPANVFLPSCPTVAERDGHPATASTRMKVLDFGVARESTRRQTNRRLAIGTPSYMAPEQARGAMDVDHRADIFSVGAILYRLLLGKELRAAAARSALPDDAPTPNPPRDEVDVAADPVPSIMRTAPSLPAAIARAIDRALAWQRDERWASAAAMLDELRAARATVSVDRLSRPTEVADEQDDSDRPTSPGTPSAIRILQDAGESTTVNTPTE